MEKTDLNNNSSFLTNIQQQQKIQVWLQNYFSRPVFIMDTVPTESVPSTPKSYLENTFTWITPVDGATLCALNNKTMSWSC